MMSIRRFLFTAAIIILLAALVLSRVSLGRHSDTQGDGITLRPSPQGKRAGTRQIGRACAEKSTWGERAARRRRNTLPAAPADS